MLRSRRARPWKAAQRRSGRYGRARCARLAEVGDVMVFDGLPKRDLSLKFTEDAEVEVIIDAKWEHLSRRLNGDSMPKWAELMYRSMMQEMIRLERHLSLQRKWDRLWLAAACGGGAAGGAALSRLLGG